jgi:hypothetical protein
VKYELLRHPDGIQVLSVADLSQHVGDTCSTRLLERGKDARVSVQTNTVRASTLRLRPDTINLLFHCDLLFPQGRRCLTLLLFCNHWRAMVIDGSRAIGSPCHHFNIPKLGLTKLLFLFLRESTYLVDHVTLWMPAFVSHISIDLHELL